MDAVVREGVSPVWTTSKPPKQLVRPLNHNSINIHAQQVREHIAKGHLDGRYLIVDMDILDIWVDIFICPIGVVDKSGPTTAIRVINDYSFPAGASVNDFSDRDDFPDISCNPPSDIARRIFELRTRFPGHSILMMLGDVSGAFQHIPVGASHVHMFAFRFEGFIVIDLSCGFGWCGSPTYYSLSGSLINSLYQQQCPHYSPAPIDDGPLVGNVWYDDRTCVEIDTSTRCTKENLALQKAIAVVLGHKAINEDKFTAWSTSTRALGLLWDTVTGTVSVPADKILKTRSRITTVLAHASCSLSTVNKLLSNVRYVSTCFPAARSFYQNVQVLAKTFPRHHMRRPVSHYVRDDLRWYLAVLAFQHKLNSIPVEHFARLRTPTRDVWMDASDTGLCVLEPQRKQFIRVEFSDTVRQTLQLQKWKIRSTYES